MSPGYSARSSQIRREIADCYFCMGHALKSKELILQNMAGRSRGEFDDHFDIENAYDDSALSKFSLALKQNDAARKYADNLLALAQKNSQDPHYTSLVFDTAIEFFKAKDYRWSLKLAQALSKFKPDIISGETMDSTKHLISMCNAKLNNAVAE